LTRLLDPDAVLRVKIVEFVSRGEFGLASGHPPASAAPGTSQAGVARKTGESGGGYERVWFNEPITPDEVGFEPGVFLLLKAKARGLKAAPEPASPVSPELGPTPEPESAPISGHGPKPEPESAPIAAMRTFRITGEVPPEIWNRLGTKVLPKLRSGADLKIGIAFSVTVENGVSRSFEADLKQILEDLGLSGRVRIE